MLPVEEQKREEHHRDKSKDGQEVEHGAGTGLALVVNLEPILGGGGDTNTFKAGYSSKTWLSRRTKRTVNERKLRVSNVIIIDIREPSKK